MSGGGTARVQRADPAVTGFDIEITTAGIGTSNRPGSLG